MCGGESVSLERVCERESVWARERVCVCGRERLCGERVCVERVRGWMRERELCGPVREVTESMFECGGEREIESYVGVRER